MNATQTIAARLPVLLILLAGVGVPACGDGSDTGGESTLDRVKRTGVVRVGFANEAPYAYLDSATGELTGEAPEIAQVILKKIGVEKIEPVLTEFGSLIPGLKSKQFDVIAAGMYITPKRARQIDFSNPTYGIGEAFIVKRGNPLGLHSYEDIKAHQAARLGVVTGTIEYEYARKVGIPPDQVHKFPDATSALAGVQAGRVDAYAGTALTVQTLLNKLSGNDVERAEPFTDPVIDGRSVRGYGAFGFRKGDDAFRQIFNQHLAQFIGTEKHSALVEPFGFTEAELPGSMTAQQLSKPNE